jgi:hypothetical protein
MGKNIGKIIPGKHIGVFGMMPAAPGTCPECATDHEPETPHNQQSLFYQYRFCNDHGRWPTWLDAMAHCTDEMRALWRIELLKRGVKLD